MNHYEFDDEKFGCTKIGLFIILFLLVGIILLNFWKIDFHKNENIMPFLFINAFITYFIWILLNLVVSSIKDNR